VARYEFTRRARIGFRNILEYVEARFGPRVAGRVLDELVAAFELLVESPGIGHQRDDLTKDERIRFWSVGPTLIAYRATADSIEILFVERGERDWEQLLDVADP
jgi:plasmid stabilization system protein ParE